MSARSDAWEQGRRRRAVLAAYIADGLGSWGAKAKLADEHPELVPAGGYANSRLNKEIAAILREQPPAESDEGEADTSPQGQYIASLERQLRACELAMETAPNAGLIMRAGQLARDLAAIRGVAVPTRRPGGRKRLYADPVVAPTPVDAPTTPSPATHPDEDAGTSPDDAPTTPLDMSQRAALARVQAAWPAMAAEMERLYPGGQPARNPSHSPTL